MVVSWILDNNIDWCRCSLYNDEKFDEFITIICLNSSGLYVDKLYSEFGLHRD